MDELGNRMKGYETSQSLIPKVPAIIRLDGKAFHTLTRGLTKPWDAGFVSAMQQTAKTLCEEIQGAIFGYVQSDEISIILIDWQKYNTEFWFSGKIQKICSVSAAIATQAFCESFSRHGVFDSRVFNIPEHDVINNIIWRQKDCIRNSIQMLGQSQFSHKELHGVNCTQIKEKLLKEKQVDWNQTLNHLKYGTAVIKTENGWQIDQQMPLLSTDRDYIKIPKLWENE